MEKLTEDELEILDNAPEGAEFYKTHSVTGAILGYAMKGDRISDFVVVSRLDSLRLRKEQEDKQQAIVEWKSGDECFVDGYAKPIYRFIGKDPENCDWCWIAVEGDGKNVLIEDLSKPESLEQKAERERKEKIESLLDCWPHSVLSATLSEFAARLVDAGVKLPEQQ